MAYGAAQQLLSQVSEVDDHPLERSGYRGPICQPRDWEARYDLVERQGEDKVHV